MLVVVYFTPTLYEMLYLHNNNKPVTLHHHKIFNNNLFVFVSFFFLYDIFFYYNFHYTKCSLYFGQDTHIYVRTSYYNNKTTTTIHEPAQRTFSTVHEIKVFFVVFFIPFQKKMCFFSFWFATLKVYTINV